MLARASKVPVMTMSVVVTWDSQQTVYYSPDVLARANKVPK